jgi:hypothetical protein
MLSARAARSSARTGLGHGWFIAVTEAGAAESLSHAVAAEGAVLAGRLVAVRLCSPWGIPLARATVGKPGDWVRRRLR